MAASADCSTVDVAVPDPVGVGVDEPGVRDVLTDVDDRHLVPGECQDLVQSADRGNRAVLDEHGFRDGRFVHGHDLADENDAFAPGNRRCRLGAALVAAVLGADGSRRSWRRGIGAARAAAHDGRRA